MLTKVDRYFAFEIFKTGTITMLPIRYIFMSHSKKSANLDARWARTAKFFFNYRDLKFNIFFLKIYKFFPVQKFDKL